MMPDVLAGASEQEIRELAGDSMPVLRAVTAGELFAMDFPPREHVLKPILSTQGTMMLHSIRGVGKTFVGLSIGAAVADGGTFLRWSAPKPRKVLYVDGEMPGVTMRDRLAAVIAGMDAEIPHEN